MNLNNKAGNYGKNMAITIRASEEGLRRVDETRKAKDWNRCDCRWHNEANVCESTLKRFWARKFLNKDTFSSICHAVGQNWEDIADSTPEMPICYPIKYWEGVLDVSVFYGRTQELEKLEEWIVGDRCRLISICGMVGMGKTTLAAKLGDRIQEQFQYLIWRSLRSAPPVKDLLVELMQLLSEEPEPSLPENLDELISLLIDRFSKYRILLVLDNLETILSSGDFTGHYREGYKKYGELFGRIGQEAHQSCMLLTSREKIREVAIYEGETSPIRSFALEGLKEAGRKILQEKGLSGENSWSKIIEIYRGNPLMLKIVSTSIKEIFNGDVGEFLKNGGTLITKDISDFLEQVYNRLSDLETQIMVSLALHEAMSCAELQAVFSPHEVMKALESLRRRSVLESSTQGFFLQPAVREYVLNEEFNQISLLQKQIFRNLATANEPKPLSELQQVLAAINPQEVQNALESLRWRSLVESSTEGFFLQPAVKDVINRLGEVLERNRDRDN
jgi:hypothetical protein